MASLLKLIVDFPCQVYIDYELKGNAEPNQLFKIPLRKGIYVLELKSSDILLYKQEYTMASNEEEDLIRINIKEEDKEKAKEKSFWDISSMDISIKEDEKGLFSGKGLYFVNNDTGEEYIVDFYRNDELTYRIEYDKEFDACGLLKINAYRDAIGMDYTVLVNKRGQVQISGYDNIVPFSNIKATVAYNENNSQFSDYYDIEYHIIDKWGNIISYCDGINYIAEEGFVGDFCVIGKDHRGEFNQLCRFYGLIDCNGKIIVDCNNSQIESITACRNNHPFDVVYLINESKIIDSKGKTIYEAESYRDIQYYYYEEKDFYGDTIKQYRFIVRKGGKYGLLDSKCNIILDYVYDSIVELNGSFFCVEKEDVISFLDSHFHTVTLGYELLLNLGNDKFLVKKKEKYGVVLISVDSEALKIKEIIQCKYEDCKYNKYWNSGERHYFMKKVDESNYLCDIYRFKKVSGNLEISKIKSFVCEDINYVLSDNCSYVIKRNGKWGILDQLDCKYDEIKKPYAVDELLVKEKGKWGILYRTECIFDEIRCLYGGHFGVIWSENNKKYIGYIDNNGIYKKEIDKSEIMVDFCIAAGSYPTIMTVIDDGNIDFNKIEYFEVPRNVYVCKQTEQCYNPEELKRIDFVLQCNDICDINDDNDDIVNDVIYIIKLIDGKFMYGEYSLKTMSYIRECNQVWEHY